MYVFPAAECFLLGAGGGDGCLPRAAAFIAFTIQDDIVHTLQGRLDATGTRHIGQDGPAYLSRSKEVTSSFFFLSEA